jgi:hypothetical protein
MFRFTCEKNQRPEERRVIKGTNLFAKQFPILPLEGLRGPVDKIIAHVFEARSNVGCNFTKDPDTMFRIKSMGFHNFIVEIHVDTSFFDDSSQGGG